MTLRVNREKIERNLRDIETALCDIRDNLAICDDDEFQAIVSVYLGEDLCILAQHSVDRFRRMQQWLDKDMEKVRTKRIVKCMRNGMLERSFETNLHALGKGMVWDMQRQLLSEYDDVFIEIPNLNRFFKVDYFPPRAGDIYTTEFKWRVLLNGEHIGELWQHGGRWYPHHIEFDCNFRHIRHNFRKGMFGADKDVTNIDLGTDVEEAKYKLARLLREECGIDG